MPPIKVIGRYDQLVSAGPGNEDERLAVLEAHCDELAANLAQLHDHLKLIDGYRSRLAEGDADRLSATGHTGD